MIYTRQKTCKAIRKDDDDHDDDDDDGGDDDDDDDSYPASASPIATSSAWSKRVRLLRGGAIFFTNIKW